jgi:beta-lactamase class D
MISPKEQVFFLEKLVTERLSIDRTTLAAIRQVSFLGDMSGHRIHGKTGSGPVIPDGEEFPGWDNFDGEFEGWLVGWVSRPEVPPVVYALYVRGPSYASIESFRGQMSIRFLRAIGALPAA